jgi:GT2 family glycosyltransferase
MKISVIMVDGGFREKFHAVDFYCSQNLPASDYEVLWVEYFGTVHENLRLREMKYSNFHVITLNGSGEYHSSYCFNEGIRRSRGEVLIVTDGDVVVESNLLARIWAEHEKNDKMAMYLYRYCEPKEEHNKSITVAHMKKVGQMTNASNFGSCLSVRKKWLIQANGYEQHPIFSSGFHANGMDMATRLKAMGMHIMWPPDLAVYHPYHPEHGVSSDQYITQRMIIEYRGQHIQFLPFKGLDSQHDRDMPAELSQAIENQLRYLRSSKRKIGRLFREKIRRFLLIS